MIEKVLGLPVDILTKNEVVSLIEGWIRNPSGKLRLLVTAYSEFFVRAQDDKEFAKIISKADLVTPDGRSVLAAVEYGKMVHGTWYKKLVDGLKVGGRILNDDLGETVTGVWLFEELTKEASRKGWKVFLLGGEHNSSQRASQILLERFSELRVAYDAGEKNLGKSDEENERIVEKINKFKPDVLFVTYSAVGQYKWIWENKDRLNAGVAMGIGGTLDEFVGDLKLAPKWMQSMGLKWLWRLWLEPKRWRRMIDAVIVFPWLVFRESLGYKKAQGIKP